MFSAAMPRPWSETATLAIPARALTWHVIGPPSGEYLIALLSRLAMIVLVLSGSTFTRTRRSGRSRSTCCGESTMGATLAVADRAMSLRSDSTSFKVRPPSSSRAASIISSISSFISEALADITAAALRPRSLRCPSSPPSSMET